MNKRHHNRDDHMNTAPKSLLIVTHQPSANLQRLADAAMCGAQNARDDAGRLKIIQCSPLQASAHDVLGADALLFGTCENLGTMAGLSKDFFDRCYYPVLEAKQGLPIAAYIRAGHDGTGTTRQLQTITTGLRWRWVAEPLVLRGPWNDAFDGQVTELASAMTIGVEQGIF